MLQLGAIFRRRKLFTQVRHASIASERQFAILQYILREGKSAASKVLSIAVHRVHLDIE